MTVTGAVTAVLHPTGVYVPPFQAGAAQRPVIHTTGSASPTGGPVNPSVSPTGSGSAAYVDAYLQAHMMSVPSNRYAILLWCVLAAISIVYALAHHLRLSGGSVGAGYTKWGMRRMTLFRRALPSNSVVLTAVFVAIVAIFLSVFGNDYIAPSSGLWDFSTSLTRRAVNNPTSPTWTIGKALWTTGSRFGITAFALMPLVVLLALKAPPFALLSLPFFTALYSDQLITFHRAAGWLIFAMTTAHVALWTAQLFTDQYNGKAVWLAAFSSTRFIFGVIAYACMCLMMVLSLRPVRKHRFEFFYIAHMVMVLLTLVACVLHHPVLWYWIAAAGALWAGDRLWRTVRYMRINAGGKKHATVANTRAYQSVHGNDVFLEEFHDKMLPPRPIEKDSGGYAAGDIQPYGTYNSIYGDQGSNNPYSQGAPVRPRVVTDLSTHASGIDSPSGVLAAVEPAPPVPVGFAQAQLLPSRTVRLTIRTGRPIKFAPGQSVMLTLPDLSKFQSHPFTICNNDGEELVLLVKARQGLTSKLYELIHQRSEKNMIGHKRSSLVPQVNPVYIRARIDGPMGSSGRVRWNTFSSVLIICGGSGVSFGLSVCEYLSRMMAGDGSRSSTKTRRVRFVWIVREYAEIAWAATALCRARQMVAAGQLHIDIYVTNAAPKSTNRTDEFSPPRPNYTFTPRSTSLDSVNSQYSRYSDEENPYDTFEEEMEFAGAQAIDLSLYEGEVDCEDPTQAELSYQVKKTGKMRRAKTRKAAKRTTPEVTISTPQETGGYGYTAFSPRQPTPEYGDSVPPATRARPQRYSSEIGLGRPSRPSFDRSRGISPRKTSNPYAPDNPYSPNNPYSGNDPYAPRPSVDTLPSQHERSGYFVDDTARLIDPHRLSAQTLDPYDAFSPTDSIASMYFDEAEDARHALSLRTRTQSMVLLPASNTALSLWVDEADYAAMSILSENARSGRPKLGKIFEEELAASEGAMLVATCGPTKLNTVVRNLVSRNIHPGKILKGDKRGHIAIFSEDFES